MASASSSLSPAVAPAPSSLSWRQAALVLGAAIGLAAGYSAAYFGTLSVFLKPIGATFGWTRAQTSSVVVLAQLGIAIGAPMVGRLIDRQGARNVIAQSVALFALAVVLLSLLPGSLFLFGFASFAIGGVAVATTPVGYLSILSRAFDRRLGLALGFAMLGLGTGTVVFPMLAQAWVSASGWQSAYRYVALTIAGGGAIALLLIYGIGKPPAAAPATARQASGAPLPGESMRTALGSGRFWLIAAVFFTVATAGLGAVVHMVSMLGDRGISPAEAARGASLIGIGVMVGRFGAGAAMDHVQARFVAAAAFLLGAAGLAVLALNPEPSFTTIACGAILVGMAIGAEGDFIPFFVRRYFGVRFLGLFYGVLLCIYSLGGVAGPILYGAAFDRWHSYAAALGAGSVACVLCALGVLLVGPYRYAAEPMR